MVKNQLSLLFVAGVVASILALAAVAPAAASSPMEPIPIARSLRSEEPSPSSGDDVSTRVLWTVVGVAAGGVAFSALYLLKRRIGAFPKDPVWIAPITIMPSRSFADEATFTGPLSEVDHSPTQH